MQKPGDEAAAGQGDPDHGQERYEKIVSGVSGGTMAVFATVGLEILPVSTLTEKLLVIVACLGLGVAVWGGFGAWRSVRKFAVMSVSASIAVICLGALSIVAGNAESPQARASGGAPDPGSRVAANQAGSSAASPAPTVSASSSPSGPPIYLADLAGDPGSTTPPQTDTWTMAGKPYSNSLGYPAPFSVETESVSYQLPRGCQWFEAMVGLNDEAGTDDRGNADNQGAVFTVYANVGGSLHQVYQVQPVWAKPRPIQVSVAGATELMLSTDNMLEDSGSEAVWGSARVVP